MKLIILLLLTSSNVFSCKLKKADFISLSGPLTFLLKEFNLENDKYFKAKLRVHDIGNSSATSLAGGLFISKKLLKKYKKPVIIFDQSKDLESTIKSLGIKHFFEIKTLGLTPFEVYKNSVIALKKITSDCETQIIKLNEKVTNIKFRILERSKHKGPIKRTIDYTKKTSLRPKFKKKTVIFFLGNIKGEKFPNLVMVNDNFVKFLADNHLITTYPSKESYVPWSSKILKAFTSPTYIGVYEDTKVRAGQVKIRKSENNIINISGNGILTPGISQVRLLPQIFQAIYK
jgi:hypothetical protein